jgi:hypothetical protein
MVSANLLDDGFVPFDPKRDSINIIASFVPWKQMFCWNEEETELMCKHHTASLPSGPGD